MKPLRAIATAAVVLAAAVAIYVLCIPPLRCAILERRIEQSTYRLASNEGNLSVAAPARANLQAITPCIAIRPATVNLYMIAAANCRLLGDNKTAVDFYKKALRYDQRPEIFANLGNAQSHLGQRREAVENFMRAYTFWPASGDEIEDPFVHDAVMRRMEQYQSALKQAR